MARPRLTMLQVSLCASLVRVSSAFSGAPSRVVSLAGRVAALRSTCFAENGSERQVAKQGDDEEPAMMYMWTLYAWYWGTPESIGMANVSEHRGEDACHGPTR